MNKEDVIRRLCALVSEVGHTVYADNREHDCFCIEQVASNPRVHAEILAYIENAVYACLRNKA